MLHYSIFNRDVSLPDGSRAIYNLITGQKLLLKGFTGAIYDSILDAPESKFAKKWKKAGFLVEGDEIAKLKLQHFDVMFNTDDFGLTICPTRSCNFRCPYCFEEHIAGRMSDMVQQKLAAFVEYFIKNKTPKRFHVTWFGGEPLLYPEIIRHMSDNFLKICGQYHVDYKASIITNGYLFTSENVKMLEASMVDSVQITLDGPKELNDKTRILANGKGSYDVIISNLSAIRTKMKISIRCNTHSQNRDGYQKLKFIIDKLREETGNDISSYPAYMDDSITADKGSLSRRSLDYEGYLEKEKSSTLKSLDGIRCHPCYCMSQYANSFVVRDDGTLCKCWDDTTIPEHTVADLMEDENPLIAQLNSEWGQKYLGLNIFEDEECRTCQLLPVCSGGCPAKRLRGQKECFKILGKRIDELILKSFYNDNDEILKL